MEDLIVKLAKGLPIEEVDIENELYEICERVHSSCDYGCPVYSLNGGRGVNNLPKNMGCDCFKNGKEMLKFIRNK
jgi:hypothetical protein